MIPSTIYLQKNNSSSYEARACTQFAMTSETPIKIHYLDINLIEETKFDEFTLPVGSVEFHNKIFNHLKIKNLDNFSYPYELRDYLNRKIEEYTVNDILANPIKFSGFFIKPLRTKLFTGFIFNSNHNYENYFDNSEHEKLISLNKDEKVFVSENINIEQEWRVYINSSKKILGYCRYDDLDTNDLFDLNKVQEMVNKLKFKHPFTLDITFINKLPVLVEANDAFAIGLYKGNMKNSDYITFLYERWIYMLKNFH